MSRFLSTKLRSLLVACLAVSAPAHVSAEVLGMDLFGLHVHSLERGVDWPSIDFGYIRLWDAGVQWRDLEPSPGTWKFGLLDRYVDEAQKRGVKVLLTLGQTPQWAASQPDAQSPFGGGASSDPRSLDDWRNYIETLAERYKGRIRAWEVWNEVNVKHFYSGDIARLAEMERIAAEILKSADATNVVLTPSLQGGAYRQLDAYLKAGGGRYADAISYHFYAPTEAPEALVERIRKVREVMAHHGLGHKPLWNTEIGWLIPKSSGNFQGNFRPAWHKWRKTGPLEAAGFVVRSFLICLHGGVRHVFWYSWDSGAMGLAENMGRTLKPAAQGYTRAREWLVGASFIGCSQSRDIWACELEREGEKQWVVWSDREQDFTIPTDWKVTSLQQLVGQGAKTVTGTALIGPLPALLSR